MAGVVFDAVTQAVRRGRRAARTSRSRSPTASSSCSSARRARARRRPCACLAGLEALTDGRDPSRRPGRRTALAPRDRDIAMVFQDYALYPQMTVYENLAFGLRMRKMPKRRDRPRGSQRAAEMLDIGELLERKPRALSGGQRQRVALGRALVREPQAFLMDEPLSNLDAKLRVQTRSEIKHLQRAGRDDDGLRHARPGRGDDDGRPRRGDERRACSSRSATPRTVYEQPGERVRRRVHREPGDELRRRSTRRATAGRLTLVARRASLALRVGRLPDGVPAEVTLGIRPEHAHLWRDGDGLMGPIEGRTEFVEMLGRETLIGVECRRGPALHGARRRRRAHAARRRGAVRRRAAAALPVRPARPSARSASSEPDQPSKPNSLWLPSQNGLFCECPHRQSVCRFRTSYGSPSAATTWTPPRTQIGPSWITATAGG